MQLTKTLLAVAVVLGLALTSVSAAPAPEGASISSIDNYCLRECKADCDRKGGNKDRCYSDCRNFCRRDPIGP
ncbi:hypothetical protein H9P43_009662 [Blastocladiella emersonii ATCC 22665]|nr:hypothetical protein H9P43_009662 [Blastocladiella emersonii ATCC 22665]